MANFKILGFCFLMENDPCGKKKKSLEKGVIKIKNIFIKPANGDTDKLAKQGGGVCGVTKPVVFKIA